MKCITLFLLRIFYGVGMIIDGVVFLITLTLFKTTLSLFFAKQIAKYKFYYF